MRCCDCFVTTCYRDDHGVEVNFWKVMEKTKIGSTVQIREVTWRPVGVQTNLSPGKLLMRINLSTLTVYTKRSYDPELSCNKFWKGRSTLNAVRSVTEMTKTVLKKKRRRIHNCVVVTLDVKIVFN